MPQQKSKEKQAAHVNDQPEMKPPCKIVLYNTFRELEGKHIDYLSDIGGKKHLVVPVGPLVKEIIDDENEHSEIIQWLDNKDESSTLFVSFGSEYFMSKEEIEKIAHGLELSKVNFIWIVRFPVGEKVELEEALPKGFIERVAERGMVVEGWAPQARILAHSSTGCFVSHCGWNSVLENLTFGIPIVAMPMHLDQPLNARLVEEVGAAMEVIRHENGRLSREVIAQVIRRIVVEKSGEDIRIKAREFSEKIRMKGGEEIDKVVKELLQLCKDR
ncbi:beta-D-glucosyl crocetin beta-1,6-glucosyltransferase-like [Camellia sinensis]|uniref:beta-D-glucosyl crocetin beta-1,6-glucosyltransferase-like n=1 Tax=Camellia sinensis TaxID=4442 RepID=UPI0010359B0A|nr:beta-D-glucosyl crocetin beta-1,6-glucosyltransferase-like [Camellia sinensis]